MKEKKYNKNILIAVDESENARRAVSYVGQLLNGAKGFMVTIMHVISEPEEDYFATAAEKEKWIHEHKQLIDRVLEEYRQILLDNGFVKDAVSLHSTLRYCPSMAECILDEWDVTRYDTIVVGRKGLSRKDEFIYGSVSSKIVHHAHNCSVWVVA
ncbi:MAG: universal stress protein [Desulfobacteraceae bacterium]|nr:universal stress protein [Desulfobacteraceae bacterium]